MKKQLRISTAPSTAATGSAAVGLFCVFCPGSKEITQPIQSREEAESIAAEMKTSKKMPVLILSVVGEF